MVGTRSFPIGMVYFQGRTVKLPGGILHCVCHHVCKNPLVFTFVRAPIRWLFLVGSASCSSRRSLIPQVKRQPNAVNVGLVWERFSNHDPDLILVGACSKAGMMVSNPCQKWTVWRFGSWTSSYIRNFPRCWILMDELSEHDVNLCQTKLAVKDISLHFQCRTFSWNNFTCFPQIL